MKKRILSLLLALAMALPFAPTELFNITANAGVTGGTSGYYTYTVSNGEATITEVHSSISGDIVIPSKLGWNNYSVVAIGDSAFQNCTAITSVTIPDSVTTLGVWAFRGCSKISSVNFGKGITEIWAAAFDGCIGLTSITIPDGVESISSSTFAGCTGLTNVTLGKKVALIGSYAFDGCTRLANIVIPSSVTTIHRGAFYGCSSLTNVYYGGTFNKKQQISIDPNDNTYLNHATWHYTTCTEHFYDNAIDTTCNECGFVKYTPGDVDNSGTVNSDDAIYLLYHTLYENDYPVNQPVDFNGDESINSDDAIYLLYHTLYENDYPLLT